jgi:acetylglutamate kinase
LGCPVAAEVEQLAEAKAARDILVHGRGVVSETYVEKAGTRARFKAGDRIDIPENYHRETWELLRKIVNDLSAAIISKFP